jgi:hypothetical protein
MSNAVPKNVSEAYFMLAEVKREMNVLKTREEGLKKYLEMHLKDGPVDGIQMTSFTRTSTSWAKVVEAFKEQLDYDQRVQLEQLKDDFTKESVQHRFGEVPKE